MTAGERAQRLYDEITYGAGVSAATAAIEAAEVEARRGSDELAAMLATWFRLAGCTNCDHTTCIQTRAILARHRALAALSASPGQENQLSVALASDDAPRSVAPAAPNTGRSPSTPASPGAQGRPSAGDGVIHWSVIPFVPICGADEPNQHTTDNAKLANCRACFAAAIAPPPAPAQDRDRQRAFKEGAEAMREQAAQLCDAVTAREEKYRGIPTTWPDSASRECAKAIRAAPAPEQPATQVGAGTRMTLTPDSLCPECVHPLSLHRTGKCIGPEGMDCDCALWASHATQVPGKEGT